MQLRVEQASSQPEESQYEGSVTLSPTSTLCADEDNMDMDVDDAEDMWADINDSTPAVEIWVPTAFFHRLNKILSSVDLFNSRYNIGDVPTDCTWGTGLKISQLVRNGQVVKIWAVGHLKSVWFFATEEDLRPSARIGLDLLRNVDSAGVRRLMNMATLVPRKSWLSTTDFCADKRDHGDRQVFHHIYDARTTYAAKDVMPKLQPTDLSIGDVVLVECGLIRSRVDRASSTQWSAWTTTFELHALSVLLSRESTTGRASTRDNGLEGFNGEL